MRRKLKQEANLKIKNSKKLKKIFKIQILSKKEKQVYSTEVLSGMKIANSDYLVLGFTYDEQKRAERFMLTERNNLLPILIEEKITKQDCFDMLLNKGLKLPQIYKHGFPNANCIGCVKATSPTYWNLVRKEFPKVFDDRAEQSYSCLLYTSPRPRD